MDSKWLGGAILTSGVTKQKRVFTWNIENFELVCKSEMLINAQKVKFQVGDISGLQTDWCGFLQKEGEKGKEKIGIYFKLEQKPAGGVKEVNAAFHVRIVKVNGGIFFERTSDYKNYMNDNGVTPRVGWGTTIPQSSNVTELPLINGRLIVNVEITVLEPMPVGTFMKEHEYTDEKFKRKFNKKLQQDLVKLHDNSGLDSNSPAIFISKDKKEFAVNRGVLSARSPVLEKMFQTNMTESETGTVQLTDISSKTVSVLLRFLYTGILRDNDDWCDDDVIVELVYAAEKYQLLDLVEFLDQVVGYVCARKTAGKLLNLAKKIPMKKAERTLMDFIKTDISTFEDMLYYTKDIMRDDIF